MSNHIKHFIILLSLVFVIKLQAQEEASSKFIPITAFAECSYSQSIYLAKDIKKVGRIKAITLFPNDRFEGLSKWQVSLGLTDKNAYQGEFTDVSDAKIKINEIKANHANTSGKPFDNLTQVFNRKFNKIDLIKIDDTNQKLVINFEVPEDDREEGQSYPEPFEYDNKQNLVLEILENDINEFETATTTFKVKKTNSKRTIFSIRKKDITNSTVDLINRYTQEGKPNPNFKTDLGTNYVPVIELSYAPYITKFPKNIKCHKISEPLLISEVVAQDFGKNTDGTLKLKWTHNGAGDLKNANTLTPTYNPSQSDNTKELTFTLTIFDKDYQNNMELTSFNSHTKSFKVSFSSTSNISVPKTLQISKNEEITDEKLVKVLGNDFITGGKWIKKDDTTYAYQRNSDCGLIESIVTISVKKETEKKKTNTTDTTGKTDTTGTVNLPNTTTNPKPTNTYLTERLNDGFSPNKDGLNDLWVIVNNISDKYPKNSLDVYNVRGSLVYQASPYKNDWDGTYKTTQKLLPRGAYFYIFKTGIGNKEYKGWVYINY